MLSSLHLAVLLNWGKPLAGGLQLVAKILDVAFAVLTGGKPGLDAVRRSKPCRLPRLILETEEDKREWERAEIRREIRRKQSAEGFHFYEE